MNDARVILLTVTGPGGRSADVGARSDATPRDLAAHLGPDLGIDPASSVVTHHAPQRPGQLQRQRLIRADVPLAASGVLDGDTLVFAQAAQPAPQPPEPAPGMAVPPQPHRG